MEFERYQKEEVEEWIVKRNDGAFMLGQKQLGRQGCVPKPTKALECASWFSSSKQA
jgi:hypothetical protein